MRGKKRVIDEKNKKMRQTYLNAGTWLSDDINECENDVMKVDRETVKRRYLKNDDEHDDLQK